MEHSTKQISVSVPVGIYKLIKSILASDETVEGFVRESIRVKLNQEMEMQAAQLGVNIHPTVSQN